MPLEQADIQALAQALKNLQPAASVNAIAVKLPQFWHGNPEVWFKQIESVFTTRNPAITTQQTKFDYVVQSLDNSTADRVQSIILNPPAQPYDKLKAALIATFGKSQAAKDQEILNLSGLGDKRPSELLQHMKNMNADPNTLFKAFFLAQLPPDVRKILATSGKTDIDELAIEADRIVEVSRLSNESQVNAASSWMRTNNPLDNGIHSPMASTRRWPPRASGLSPHPTPLDTRPAVKMDTRPAGGRTPWRIVPGLCRLHSRFGELATSCTPPCKFVPNTNQGNFQTGRK